MALSWLQMDGICWRNNGEQTHSRTIDGVTVFAWHQFVPGFSILELKTSFRLSFAIDSVFEFSSAVTVLTSQVSAKRY
jgi:hypothetical protein